MMLRLLGERRAVDRVPRRVHDVVSWTRIRLEDGSTRGSWRGLGSSGS